MPEDLNTPALNSTGTLAGGEPRPCPDPGPRECPELGEVHEDIPVTTPVEEKAENDKEKNTSAATVNISFFEDKSHTKHYTLIQEMSLLKKGAPDFIDVRLGGGGTYWSRAANNGVGPYGSIDMSLKKSLAGKLMNLLMGMHSDVTTGVAVDGKDNLSMQAVSTGSVYVGISALFEVNDNPVFLKSGLNLINYKAGLEGASHDLLNPKPMVFTGIGLGFK